MNKLTLVSIYLLILGLGICACASMSRPAMSEFKQLKTSQRPYPGTYPGLEQATSASEVVSKFGKPSKSEDVTRSDDVILPKKYLYYDAKDEFGNSCMAKLRFLNACQNGSSDLDCYHLVNVESVPQ